jgi:uncharacterized membrane protein
MTETELGKDQRLEIAMGHMLRIGVTIAALVVLAGGVLYLSQNRGPVPDYHHFRGAPTIYEHVGQIAKGARHFDSRAIIEFGILLLIATPVMRVVFGVVGFAFLRDRLYTLVSAVVLAVLLFSFLYRQ